MNGKLAVVTGASNGIGLVTARSLASLGAEVVMVARDPRRGEVARRSVIAESGNERVSLLLCDFADLGCVRDVADEVRARWGRVDVLCDNAGAILPERRITTDGCELTMQTNHFAHFLLTLRLEPALKAPGSPRVVVVSSDAHLAAFRGIPFDDLTFERGWSPFRAYSISKLANIMFAYELARRWGDAGVAVNAMHPGLVQTGFGTQGWGVGGSVFSVLSRPFQLDADEGADTEVYLASSPDVEHVTGRYFYRRTAKRSSPVSYDTHAQKRLWDVSERLVAGYLRS